jgi:hypothetical protein
LPQEGLDANEMTEYEFRVAMREKMAARRRTSKGSGGARFFSCCCCMAAAAAAAAVTLRDILRAYFVVCKPHMFVIRVQQKHMKVGVSPSKPLSLCLASAATYSSPSTSRREHGLHGDAPRAASDTKRDQPIAGGSREKVMGTR